MEPTLTQALASIEHWQQSVTHLLELREKFSNPTDVGTAYLEGLNQAYTDVLGLLRELDTTASAA